MSLNHHKLVATRALGSYEVLNGLRNSACLALDDTRRVDKRGNTVDRAGLRAKVRELEAEREVLLEELLLLQWALDLRCVHARQYALKADKATQVRCQKEQSEIDISLSLRRRPVPHTNVTPIQRGRRREHT